MIKNWIKFNESVDSEVSYETLSEIIFYLNNSLLSVSEKLHRKIDTFIEVDLNGDCDELTPITPEEYRQFHLKIEGFIKIIKENPEFISKLNSLYNEVQEMMKGLPKFYELEDFFLDLIDDGWQLTFLLKPNESIDIEVSNDMSDLQISYDDYINLQIECGKKLKRMKSVFSNTCEIIESDYSKRGQKNVALIKFQLSVR